MASSSNKSAVEANLLGKRKSGDDLETRQFLRKHKERSEEKETTEGFADDLQQIKGSVELLETKSDQANFISAKEVAVRKKTLLITHLPRHTEISDIINFFKNVGEVVRVQRIVNRKGEICGFAYVEFASANEAKKALEEKNGQYMREYKIFLDVVKASYPPKYCIDHKVVWFEDYLRRESLLIEEDDTVEGLVEEVPARKKTLFVANLSPQTKISDINGFFKYVGEVVSVRLIVNQEGKHVGCGFVEFASANNAKTALEKKNGKYLHDRKIFLDVSKIAPHAPRPKYNLAEKLWYEDYLIRESFTAEGLDEHSDFVKIQKIAIRNKTLFVGHLSRQAEISDIISFFNYVGEVISVRLILNRTGEHCGYGFVEFASANEAKKALEEKNGENLCGQKIVLGVAEIASHPPQHCIDHKVWYEDYLGREILMVEEDETVEGLVEEVAARAKTRFVANLPDQIEISDIIKFFQNVGKVVGVRLIVNHKGKHVGCGFVEFASADTAKKALDRNGGTTMKSGRLIFVDVAEIAPYPIRPKYNLAEKLWYEDYLQRESLMIDDLKTKPMLAYCGTKITFDDNEEAICEEDEARR